MGWNTLWPLKHALPHFPSYLPRFLTQASHLLPVTYADAVRPFSLLQAA